jgi:hypothetical protein
MTAPLPMFSLATYPGLSSAIGLQAFPAGRTLLTLLASLGTAKSGRGVAPASRSRVPAPKLAAPIPAIFGRRGIASSVSAALQSSLVSRLKARLDTGGSTVFAMTWKETVTPSGRSVSLLRASARSIADSESGSWPTPDTAQGGAASPELIAKRALRGQKTTKRLSMFANLAQDDGAPRKTPSSPETACTEWSVPASWPTPQAKEQQDTPEKKRARGSHDGLNLSVAAQMTTWPTPRAEDSESTGAHRGAPDTLTSASRLTPWATPVVRDTRNSAGDGTNPRDLPRQVSGVMPTGSLAATAKPGQLNPRFSLWLMGYPTAWASCGERAIRLSRNLRQKSSKAT